MDALRKFQFRFDDTSSVKNTIFELPSSMSIRAKAQLFIKNLCRHDIETILSQGSRKRCFAERRVRHKSNCILDVIFRFKRITQNHVTGELEIAASPKIKDQIKDQARHNHMFYYDYVVLDVTNTAAAEQFVDKQLQSLRIFFQEPIAKINVSWPGRSTGSYGLCIVCNDETSTKTNCFPVGHAMCYKCLMDNSSAVKCPAGCCSSM